MRITWFGGSTFRLYLGGEIFVTDLDHAPKTLDKQEIGAAADYLINLRGDKSQFPQLDIEHWRAKRPVRVIDAPEQQGADIFSFAGGALFIDEMQEGPVIFAPKELAEWGRFADGAIVILSGDEESVFSTAQALLNGARPKLMVLAVTTFSDARFAELAMLCGDSALQILEQGFAIEA